MDHQITNEPNPPANPLPNLNSLKQAEGSTKERTADSQISSGSSSREPAEGKPQVVSPGTGSTEAASAQPSKEQLHQRVDARMRELEAALGQLDGHLAKGERALTISGAIATAQASLSGGWEHVGEIEAAQLSQ